MQQPHGQDQRQPLAHHQFTEVSPHLRDKLDRRVVPVATSSLRVSDSPRTEGENEEHARMLAESSVVLPAIVVHRATMRVIDGAHRLMAAALRAEQEIAVMFFDGDETEAFLLAVELNVQHGLPLSLSDRSAAAERILAVRPEWSDRAIALSVGLSATTVRALRNRATAQNVQLHEHRIGRDGRLRPVSTEQGRVLASRLLHDEPEISLRQIAKRAGVSVGTVRDVRDRMQRGEDVVPDNQRQQLPTRRTTGNLDGTPGQRVTPITEQGDLLAVLGRDPSLRFSETGRTLLRLFNLHAIAEAQGTRLLETVPGHCTNAVAQLARSCAGYWEQLARQIEVDEQAIA